MPIQPGAGPAADLFPQTEAQMQRWAKRARPDHRAGSMEYEMVSGLRRACVNKILTPERAWARRFVPVGYAL
jgi:hypothetical protein